MMQCGHAAQARRAVNAERTEWIPSCVICDCIEVARTPLDLTGRKARCCNEASERDSSLDLAFFEYLGADSHKAKTMCGNCRFYEMAHDPEVTKNYVQGKPKRVCDNFEPHGAYEFDSYYCGHSGWD
jgi:hypothetical protein